MQVGVISDTHDKLQTIQQALDIFHAEDVELVIHCGDWKTPATVHYFAEEAEKRNLSVKAVLGNRDTEKEKIREENKYRGETIVFSSGDVYELMLDDKQTVIYHGHHKPTLKALINSEKYTVIFTGHTHKPKIEKHNEVLIINPGSTAFTIPRTKNSKPTVALYNSKNNLGKIIEF